MKSSSGSATSSHRRRSSEGVSGLLRRAAPARTIDTRHRAGVVRSGRVRTRLSCRLPARRSGGPGQGVARRGAEVRGRRDEGALLKRESGGCADFSTGSPPTSCVLQSGTERRSRPRGVHSRMGSVPRNGGESNFSTSSGRVMFHVKHRLGPGPGASVGQACPGVSRFEPGRSGVGASVICGRVPVQRPQFSTSHRPAVTRVGLSVCLPPSTRDGVP